LLGLATFKPQFALAPFAWFVLTGRWRLVGAAAVVSMLMAAPIAVILGPIESITDWLAAARAYEGGEVGENALGFYVIMGVPSVIAAAFPGAGAYLPSVSVLILAGAAVALVLRLSRRLVVEDDVLGLLLGAQFTLLYGKYVDLALLAPLLAGLLIHAGRSRRQWLVILAGAALLFIPAALFIRLGVKPLNHFRTFIVLAGLAWLVVQSVRARYRWISDLAGAR
jgi:hypothetical protein